MIGLPDEYLFPLKKLRNHCKELISAHTKEMEELAEKMRLCSEKLQESEDAFAHVNALIPADSDLTDSLINGYVDMALESASSSEQLTIEFEQLSDEFDAIKKILSMYPGTLCDVKFVVKMLYENPDEESYDRISKLLKNGSDNGAWYVMPDNHDCYTIDIGLIQMDNIEPRIETRGKKKKAS